VKKLDGNDQNILPTTHGSCITTKHLLTRHCLILATKQITVLEHPVYNSSALSSPIDRNLSRQV